MSRDVGLDNWGDVGQMKIEFMTKLEAKGAAAATGFLLVQMVQIW
jgi:hypothetical protein